MRDIVKPVNLSFRDDKWNLGSSWHVGSSRHLREEWGLTHEAIIGCSIIPALIQEMQVVVEWMMG